jgi:hypothetical protein
MALQVSLGARAVDAPEDTALAVHVSVAGGVTPLKLTLHLDGRVVGRWDSVADVYEFRVASLAVGPRALTVRVVDAVGRWGSRSVMVDGRAGREPDPEPRVTLRSSVKSRLPASPR